MSHLRRRETPPGIDPQFGDSDDLAISLGDLTRGLHSGLPADALPDGFTPDSRNFEVAAGKLRPRSGTSFATQSSSGTTGFLGSASPPLGAAEVFDADQRPHAIAATQSKIFFLRGETGTWTQLSPATGTSVPSGTVDDHWEITSIYDPSIDQNLAILTNGRDTPKYVVVKPGVGVYSDFTFLSQLGMDAPVAVGTSDSRLIFANPRAPDRQATRVIWSARGAPTSFQLADGAGFEDRRDMRGEIQGIRSEADGFLLFSTEEIWRGRPRRDFFAFDFHKAAEVAALNPRTAIETPAGVFFLGRDLEPYVIQGATLTPLGQRARNEASRVQSHLRSNLSGSAAPWSLYSERRRRWELFYSASTATYPDRCLYYDLEADSFLEQRFGEMYSAGFDFETVGLADLNDTWDGGSAITWDAETSLIWDNYVTAADPSTRRPLLLTSAGSVEQVFSDRTVDVTGEIDARWRSGGLRHPLAQRAGADPWQRVWIREAWAEYAANTASSATARWTDDGGSSFREERQWSVRSSAYSASLIPVRFGGRAPQVEIMSEGDGPALSGLGVRIKLDSPRGGGTG